MKRLAIVVALSVSTAFLACGCLWGQVRDALTGDGVPGATVKWTDSEGHEGSTKTAGTGLYVFDGTKGDPVPATGLTTFEVSAPGYVHTPEAHLVDYNDNPGASLDDPSSYWEIRHLYVLPLTPVPQGADLAITDLFPDKLPKGQVFVRVTNNGPPSVTNLSIYFACEYEARDPIEGTITDAASNLQSNVTVSLNAGQTGVFATPISVDTTGQFYDVTCTLGDTSLWYGDNPLNNTYSERIPP